MPRTRKTRLVCLTCSLPMTKDDREHYGYQCHPCVVREHELVVTLRGDPDHPDLLHLTDGPVDLGYGRRDAQL
jgi:hypothetical protein